MSGSGSGGGGPSYRQLIAGMQAVESLRAQNQAAAHTLAAQLQRLNAQVHARDAVANRFSGLQAPSNAAAASVSAPPPFSASQFAAVQAAAARANLAPLPRLSGCPSAISSPSAGTAAAVAAAQAQAVAASALAAEQSGLGSSASQPSGESRDGESALPAREAEEGVPRCHLHRKQNKACKFCKVYYQAQDEKNQKLAQERTAALERWKEGSVAQTGKGLAYDEKAPLPNLQAFPPVWADRIQKNDYYAVTLGNLTISELKSVIAEGEACDVESRAEKTLDMEPSPFICSVYRLLAIQLTEGQIKSLSSNRSVFLRAAGFLYVRLGMHHERYWELLSDSLMETEEFIPFPAKNSESMTMGQYVEQLLTKDKYCDLPLPRIPVLARKVINKRMVLYAQFRRRYAANLEVIDRFKEPGVKIEVCSVDGEWTSGRTLEAPNLNRHCKTLLVKMPDGEDLEASLGMIIAPSNIYCDKNDLTRCRGKSAEDLLERYEMQLRDAAVASGKDYCKTSGQHTLRVGGVPFVAGVKRKDLETERPQDDAERDAKRSGPSLQHQAKLAAIESKYLARVGSSAGRSERRDTLDGPERMRLG